MVHAGQHIAQSLVISAGDFGGGPALVADLIECFPDRCPVCFSFADQLPLVGPRPILDVELLDPLVQHANPVSRGTDSDVVADVEMGMLGHDQVISRIKDIPGYVSEFQVAFGKDDGVTIENAVEAIAAFERTLITSNSAFDRFILGDQNALTDQQIHGMKLFSSVGCTECHSGAAFNN